MSNSVRSEDTVTLSKKEFNDMMGDVAFLNCLEVEGVFRWDGYARAKELWSKELWSKEAIAEAS